MAEVIFDMEYTILGALGADADFLYNIINSYIKDAQSNNRSNLVEMCQTIKQDRQKHTSMLRKASEQEIRRSLRAPLCWILGVFLIRKIDLLCLAVGKTKYEENNRP
jgi:hypothetical protein